MNQYINNQISYVNKNIGITISDIDISIHHFPNIAVLMSIYCVIHQHISIANVISRVSLINNFECNLIGLIDINNMFSIQKREKKKICK